MDYDHLQTAPFMPPYVMDEQIQKYLVDQQLYNGDMMIAEYQFQPDTMMYRYLHEPQHTFLVHQPRYINDMPMQAHPGMQNSASHNGHFRSNEHSACWPTSSPSSSTGQESLTTGATVEQFNSISSASSPIADGVAPALRHEYVNAPAHTCVGHEVALDSVFMPGVQLQSDIQQHLGAYDDYSQLAYSSYQCLAQEGYQPVSHESAEGSPRSAYDFGSHSQAYENDDPDATEVAEEEQEQGRKDSIGSIRSANPIKQNIRTRRPSSNKVAHHTDKAQKVGKSSRRRGQYEEKPDTPGEDDATPGFPCPFHIYGCSSSFRSKNEWKRHINTQHIRSAFWRCDQCVPNAQGVHNDFNRKDLFTQHIRRMHLVAEVKPSSAKKASSKKRKVKSEDETLAEASERCCITTRVLPARSRCLFCPEVFHGPTSWDARLEHMGHHMEKAKRTGEDLLSYDWRIDTDVEQYLLEQGIIAQQGQALVCVELIRS